MKALQVNSLSDDLSGVGINEVAVPEPGAGQVLIRVFSASLNFPDLLMTRGLYQMKPDMPFTLGGDCSGEVAAVGEGVSRIKVGDRVTGIGVGAFADYVVLPEATVDPMPAGLSNDEAAAFGAAYLTAYVALVERARIQAGETALIHGAAGGMGLAATDLARALGARVIATGIEDHKLAKVDELYTPSLLINSRDGFKDRVKEATGGAGADVIFDPVNGDVFDESVRCINFCGRILVVGFVGNRITSLPTNLTMIKCFSVVGVRAGEYGRRFPDRRRLVSQELKRFAEEKAIQPHVHASFDFDDWRSAFASMQQQDAVGKVVIRVNAE
ncbi:NADPH2:quinone reductase [Sphingobium sp. OAS761]|uniref:NADPH:quinone oxidoreductase family protein n=1 Tax=Sphingobium sp. OAS761 TaxID=2817901 RepID=UPI00209D2F08|nr:NADPH:quinone oxidoreductase family protein [Sphingobium sp. OAS761]MCP1470188.1 NADPH2:quinone reductase [Sphingobium sp. OAS761]